MTDLSAILIVASLGVVGNIAYFEYRLARKQSTEVLKERLTKLLLPLYLILEDRLQSKPVFNPDFDWADYISEEPTRLLQAAALIVKENIYLADEELHAACMRFLDWAYGNLDDNERFQKLMSGKLTTNEQVLEEFKEIVRSKYVETRKLFLKRLY